MSAPVLEKSPPATDAIPTATKGAWRSADLELLPDNGVRYEIVNGES